MKKIILVLILPFLLLSCANSPEDYQIFSETQVDGYYIYELEHKGLFCNTYYEDVYYSGETFNYGFVFEGCSPAMTFFIIHDGDYVYLLDALNEGFITIESLMPLMVQLERHPEEISSDETDYYWLDFHIMGRVVYAYAGGECDQMGTETFTIDGEEYEYTANGCLEEHILFMEVDGEFVPVANLLSSGFIDGEYLIPLLTPSI